MRSKSRGFTLIEVMVVTALLAAVAAVAVPNMIGVSSKGRDSAIKEDQRRIDQAVDAFTADFHAGPDGTPRWGAGAKGRWYPTRNGLPGLLELSTSVFDPKNIKNPRVDKFAPGPASNGAATSFDIVDSAIWMGLLVNPARNTVAGTENEASGTAHALAGEVGAYLKEYPESAGEANTDTDSNGANNNGLEDGFYTWVLLSTRQTVPAYLGAGTWYAAIKSAAEFGPP